MRTGATGLAAVLLLGVCSAVSQTAAPPAVSPAPTPSAPATSSAPAGTGAAGAAAWKPFQEMAFLSGSWTGAATVASRVGGRVARIGPEFFGAFFVFHGSTILAAEEGGRSEETLEEEGWIAYDRDKRKYVATWYFSNGVTGVFDVELLTDGIRLVSREVVNYEAGTRARLVFQKRPEGDVAMNVDLAPPGKDFVAWIVSALRKK
jgi:hypothetical protein